MKYPNIFSSETDYASRGINTFSLIAVSLLWGHMLGYVSWWALPITVIMGLIAFGTEVSPRVKPKTTMLSL